MILVDTSIWVDHLRHTDAHLAVLLNQTMISIHPFVVGELACGNLRQRDQILGLLKALPQATMATNNEVFEFIERFQLMGQGVGFIDSHLLASAKLDASPLWTGDKRLARLAQNLGIGYQAG